MVILGLTGSIAMGKSVAATMLRRLRVPVHDADATVHHLLRSDRSAIAAVEAAFPGVTVHGAVDRRLLGNQVFGSTEALARLEAILHPRVRESTRRFLSFQARRRQTVVVLDIPLLFETGAERRCDAVMVVDAPEFLQTARALRRPSMTLERLNEIKKRQLPNADKRRRAEFVIPSGLGRAHTLRCLKRVLRWANRRTGRQWPPRGHQPVASAYCRRSSLRT